MDRQQYLPEKLSPASRVRRSHQEARTAYNRLSAFYDILALSERKFLHLALEMLAVKPSERLLDLGCATGTALAALAQATRQQAKLIGCDLSTGMLAKAGAKLILRGDHRAVDLIAADAAKIPVQNDSIDAILMSFTLELFDIPEIPLILAECRRVLKTNGRMAVVSLAKTTDPGWMERAYEWLHEHYEQFADCRPIFLAKHVCDSGLRIVKNSRQVMWGLPVDILLCTNDHSEV